MYGDGSKWRYLIGFGLVILLLFVIIFMIVRGGGGDDRGKVPETKKTLVSYATNDDVTLTSTLIGPVTAPQNHNEVQIEVTNSQATVNVMNGYDGNIINSRSYPLTTEAFTEFLSALDKAKYTEGDTDEALRNDDGYCATGQRYVFEIREGGNNIQRFWATSCGGTKTFKGNTGAVLELFQNQIPDYNEITDDVSFGSTSFL